MMRSLIAFSALPLLASCVAPREAAPVRAPAPVARPVPPPAAVADRYAGDWSVADLPPGDWGYAGSSAASEARLTDGGAVRASMRCDARVLTIAREGRVPADMAVMLTIRTSFAERSLPIRVVPGAPGMLGASLPASDPLWDQIVYSRGRFVIEATRNAPMIVPTRAELVRVVEDCRG